ncbi:hypothetical protein WJX73_007152 [Symbiochloris irregularis]|uniref:Uncharacterized protein n=1 Tax=Symbiochloris irregularis TaxID=706552 RepID=A0AAW1NRZ0_9CHLO
MRGEGAAAAGTEIPNARGPGHQSGADRAALPVRRSPDRARSPARRSRGASAQAKSPAVVLPPEADQLSGSVRGELQSLCGRKQLTAPVSLVERMASLPDSVSLQAMEEFDRSSLLTMRDPISFLIGILKRLAREGGHKIAAPQRPPRSALRPEGSKGTAIGGAPNEQWSAPHNGPPVGVSPPAMSQDWPGGPPDMQSEMPPSVTEEPAGDVVDEAPQTQGNGATGGKKRPPEANLRKAIQAFVKQCLKPAWKEGTVDVAAFKLISKKTVDKVMAAAPMETRHMDPKSDWGIQYLTEARQAKIQKMVDAYCIKHGKSLA